MKRVTCQLYCVRNEEMSADRIVVFGKITGAAHAGWRVGG